MAPSVRRKKQDVVVASASLVASSARYSGTLQRVRPNLQSWQTEAYRFYRIIPEARAAARFFGRALSRTILNVSTVSTEGRRVTREGAAFEDLQALFNGPQGQAQMLEAIGVHLTIAGECYLVGRTPLDEDGFDLPEIWEIASVKEMTVSGRTWTLKYGDQAPIKLADDDTVIRIWIPDPEDRMAADSPFHSLMGVLAEIEGADQHVAAQLTSRLAGAGILFLPQGMTFPPPPVVEGQEQVVQGNEAVNFMQTLGAHMIAPVQDRANPAALVPIVVIAPDDAIDKVKLQEFWSPLDQNIVPLREGAIRRFAVGMDLPVEQVLGMSSNSGTGGGNSNGVSHWGAWQIEESTIKMFIEPVCELVCNALTISYLRMIDTTYTEVVTYDTSPLRLRPDRSKESMELWQIGKLSTKRMLEENGFTEADLPDDAESKKFILTKIALGSPTPEMVGAAIKDLTGLDIMPALTPPARADKQYPELPAAPSLEDHPTKPRTPLESGISRALIAACEGLVLNGLMRAGNRIRSGRGVVTNGDCPAYNVHTQVAMNGKSDFVLEDAFPTAGIVLEGLADPAQVTPVLTSYCKNLFVTQEPHTRENLVKYLEAGVTA